MEKKLEDYLVFNESLPFLFIGSGFSRRYLGTPDWERLLMHFCNEIDPSNPLLFYQYSSAAKAKIYKDNLDASSVNILNSIIADYIEQEYNRIWYTDDRFASMRTQYSNEVISGCTPFRLALANYFASFTNNHAYMLPGEIEKLKLLSHNSIAGIITTNYDLFLENIFDFMTYIGQEKLLFSPLQGIGEIYKIHGCCTDPRSIIINSDDYNKLNLRSRYLAAKLLTIFVEHPIVFIGYSISDEDIKNILNNIAICLDADQLNTLKSRFIFIERLSSEKMDDYEIDSISYHTVSGKDFPMTRIKVNDYGMIYEILALNHTKYPVKWLRMLKENVYDLVATTTPTDKVKIMLPFENTKDFTNVEFVIGVGISKLAESAYSSFCAEDIYRDIVFDDQQFDPDLLLEKTMYDHLSRTCGSMPLFKYLAGAQKPIPNCIHKYIKHDIEDFYNGSIRRSRTIVYGSSIASICENFVYPQNLYYIVRLPYKHLTKESLKDYLMDVLTSYPTDIYTGEGHPHSSDLRRLIKIYDWMCYHDLFKEKASV